MIVFVLLRHRISVLPMDIHKDRFNHYSSVCMVEDFLDVIRPSNFDNLFSFLEVLPFVLEEILHSTRVVSYCFVVDIFVVDIGSC